MALADAAAASPGLPSAHRLLPLLDARSHPREPRQKLGVLLSGGWLQPPLRQRHRAVERLGTGTPL